MTTALTVGTIESKATVVGNNPFTKATFADWINYCDVKPATQKTYNKAVENFAGYLMNNNISLPTRDDVISYREWLLANNYKPSSARLYLTIVKKIFKWLASKMIYANVADNVKLPEMPTDEHSRDPLTLEEARATISSFKGKRNKLVQTRRRALLSILFFFAEWS